MLPLVSYHAEVTLYHNGMASDSVLMPTEIDNGTVYCDGEH